MNIITFGHFSCVSRVLVDVNTPALKYPRLHGIFRQMTKKMVITLEITHNDFIFNFTLFMIKTNKIELKNYSQKIN